jgi:hypothetical protein
MNISLKKIAAFATVAALAVPFVAMAQTGSIDIGLEYATSIGLGTQDVRTTVSGVIRAFMGLLGIVAVCLILYGGFRWMTAMGSPEKVDEAKKIIIAGVIGLIIIFAAYAIAQFVINAIVSGTSG